MTNGNDAAYPNNMKPDYGLSKREYFAAMAMQGLCADSSMTKSQSIASLSVACADALIEELNKQQ